jgi:hypothetical protein
MGWAGTGWDERDCPRSAKCVGVAQLPARSSIGCLLGRLISVAVQPFCLAW